ncbi:hydroxyisourate hydrolase [Robertmurraya korlensis]|uniref:hydroxyisourate hydrolase n=1 Tax=Robertmurraya korlensis TaxID=519977 RepID=UPI00203F5C29|nr:hydroxyisourate hydrolase [Robertmurraya korlensis]MCM3599863.1 hydroxyisourate hydrolase [Robertmurraya korlensis]
MTGLTTHILDLTHGLPASNVPIELYSQDGNSTEWILLKTDVTNDDGRLDSPLVSEKEIKAGCYELVFHIGTYFRSKNIDLPDPPFLDKIPVRFNIVDTTVHYHVPLLVSPWGYQVYRGS